MYNQCFNSHFWNKYSYERKPLRIGCNILCALFLLSSEQYIRIFTRFFYPDETELINFSFLLRITSVLLPRGGHHLITYVGTKGCVIDIIFHSESKYSLEHNIIRYNVITHGMAICQSLLTRWETQFNSIRDTN